MSSHGISAHKKIRNMESYDIIPMLINPFIPSFPKSRQMGNITRKSRIGLDMDVLFEVVEAEGGWRNNSSGGWCSPSSEDSFHCQFSRAAIADY